MSETEPTPESANPQHHFRPHSEAFDTIVAAVAKAQATYENVGKTQIATVKGKTATGAAYEYQYSYADLGDVMDMLRKPMADNGLALSGFTYENHEGALMYEQRVYHTSGQWLAAELALPEFRTLQGLGSHLSYLRRYLGGILVNVVTEKDSSGELGADETKTATEKKARGTRKAAAKAPARGTGPKPPDTDAIAEAQLKAFWIGLRTVAELGGVLKTSKDVEKAVGAMIKAQYGLESTKKLSQGQRVSIGEEFRRLYGPRPEDPSKNDDDAPDDEDTPKGRAENLELDNK